MTTARILSGIKQTLHEGHAVKIDLTEASALTGSGDGIGGRTFFDNAFAALRFANPIRELSRVIPAAGSSVQFVAKTGNAANSTNPWLYAASPNTGSPNTATSIWQLPTRVVSASLPVRTAVMSDINYLNETLVEDMMLEFAQLEGASMVLNNDQTGSTTTSTGSTNGLRGLNYYASGSAAYGSSGTAITDGIHTLLTVSQNGAAIVYDDLVNLAKSFPPQYWNLPGCAWMMHPDTIHDLRQLKAASSGNASRLLAETGDDDGGAVANIFGWPVIANPNMETIAAGKFTIYLANWPRFVTIADVEEMTVQAMEQSAPGFITLYAERRMVSTVRDPFAGVRLVGV